MSLASHIGALVVVSVRKVLLSLAMLVAVEQLSFVDAAFVFEGAFALLPAIAPLSFVAVSLLVPPNPESMPPPSFPLSFVDLAIIPLKTTLPLSHVIQVVSHVKPIVVHLTAMHSLVVLELALENRVWCQQNAIAVHFVGVLPKVDRFGGWNYFEVGFGSDCPQTELEVHGVVVVKEVLKAVRSGQLEFLVLADGDQPDHLLKPLLCDSSAELGHVGRVAFGGLKAGSSEILLKTAGKALLLLVELHVADKLFGDVVSFRLRAVPVEDVLLRLLLVAIGHPLLTLFVKIHQGVVGDGRFAGLSLHQFSESLRSTSMFACRVVDQRSQPQYIKFGLALMLVVATALHIAAWLVVLLDLPPEPQFLAALLQLRLG
jgi:hypothetical protein